jgi:hypothetical protein
MKRIMDSRSVIESRWLKISAIITMATGAEAQTRASAY